MTAGSAERGNGPEPTLLRALCDALEDNSQVLQIAAAQIAEIDHQLQDAAKVVCGEFQVISAALDKSSPQVRERVERIVVALQFEDRFSQRLLQVSRALSMASRLSAAVLSQSGMSAMALNSEELPGAHLTAGFAGLNPFELLREAARMVTSKEPAETEFFQ